MYMIDWYDRNQCHHGNVEGHDRSNGRIFKVSYGTPQHVPVDLKGWTTGHWSICLLAPQRLVRAPCAPGHPERGLHDAAAPKGARRDGL